MKIGSESQHSIIQYDSYKEYDNAMHWADVKLMWAGAGYDNVIHRADGKVCPVSCAPGVHRITHKASYMLTRLKKRHVFSSL